MAVFSNTIITKKGHALVAKGMTGEQINFTKVRTSDYDYLSSTNFENLTVLGSIKQTVDISAVNIENESTVRVKAAILNTDVTTGYYVKNIGLYANDPDEGEILFSITTATLADFIPAHNGVNTSVLTVDLLTTVSNSGNVNLTVSPGGLVTTEMIATENQYGIVTLSQIYKAGMAPRGELPKPVGAVYTYGEMLIIPDGQYNINTQTVFSYLGLGSSFMNTGVLFKKTYTVNGIKRVNLNYINSAMDTGITGMSMFFIDVSSENAKNLHTSTTNSGLWQIEQSWGKFNLSAPGYFKMGNGLTFQWFFAQTLASNGDAGTLISYPIAFDNTVLTLQGTDGGSGAHTIGANIVDRFQCRVWGRFPSTGALINSTLRILAIGY